MDAHAGLEPGDRVALLQPGSTAYVELVVALLARGIFPVPLDPRLTAAERDGILADVRPALVVDTPEAFESLAARSRPAAGVAGALPLGRPMHVTSGTTGRPKAVDSGILDTATGRGAGRRGARPVGVRRPPT